MTLTLVSGPDDPEATRWATRFNAPDTGRLAVMVPPGAALGSLARELLGALGRPALTSPDYISEAETFELALALFAAHQIDSLVLAHADWLPTPVVEPLMRVMALAGVEVFGLVGPNGDRRLDAWATCSRSWVGFVEEATRDEAARKQRALDPARNQRSPIGPLGLPQRTRRVAPDTVPSGASLAAFLDVAARLRRDGRTSRVVAHSVALSLRSLDGDEAVREWLPGAALALTLAGYRLWCADTLLPDASVPQHDGPLWVDLRSGLFPFRASAVALLAAGLWPDEAARVGLADVARDGSQIRHGGRSLPVPSGAVPFVVAQRRLREMAGAGPTDRFLVHRRRALSAHAIAVTAQSQLHEAGVQVELGDIAGRLSKSGRWLARRGIVVRPFRLPRGPMVSKIRRCRHGLPDTLTVDGVALSHSQRLCLGQMPAGERATEIRPPEAGYVLHEVRSTALGRTIAVSRDETPRGELVAIETPRGPVWLQVGTGTAPSLERIWALIEFEYPQVLGVPDELSQAPATL